MSNGFDEKRPAVSVDEQALTGYQSVGKWTEPLLHRMSLGIGPADHQGSTAQPAFSCSLVHILNPSPSLRRARVLLKPDSKRLIQSASQGGGLFYAQVGRAVTLTIPKPAESRIGPA